MIDPTIMISSSSTADACVCSYTPSTNYQMATQLRTGFCTDYGIRRSLLRFEIPSSIPAGSVTNARFDMEKMSGYAPKVRAMRVIESWSSGTVNFNNQPLYTAVNASNYATQLNGGSWYTMDVTAIVQSWVNGTYVNYGFMFKDLYESSSNTNKWTTWYSSDAVSPHKPELYITYIPTTPSITITDYNTYMQVGQTYTFAATTDPVGSTVTWISSYPNIASVNPSTGVVTALYPGTTTITATANGQSDSCTVEVSPISGYDYDITITHYYDEGFYLRNYSSEPTPESKLVDINDRAASRFASIFSLNLNSNYNAYTSIADMCKKASGTFTSDGLNNYACSHEQRCANTVTLRDELIEKKRCWHRNTCKDIMVRSCCRTS